MVQVLDKLEKLGRLDNAVIIFTSDHGDLMGERNYIFRKYNLYESSVRVPLIISGTIIPENQKGSIDSRLAEHIDLLPTIAKLAQAPINPILPGIDLLSDTKRSGAFSEFHGITDEGFQASPAYMWKKKSISSFVLEVH